MWTAAFFFFVEHYLKIFLLERFFAVHETIKIGATNILVAVTKVVQHHYFKLGGCCPEKKLFQKRANLYPSTLLPQHECYALVRTQGCTQSDSASLTSPGNDFQKGAFLGFESGAGVL